LTTTLSSNTNNLFVTGIESCNYLRINPTTNLNITGLTAPIDPTQNQTIYFMNIGSSNITLKDNSPSSTPENRFLLDTDTVIVPNKGGILLYDQIDNRWRYIGDD